MGSFELPLTVRTASGEVDLVLTLTGRVPFGSVAGALLGAAGLPAGTRLHHGAGPCEGTWICGDAPLVAGVVLTVDPTEPPLMCPVALSVVAGPDAGGWVPVADRPITVGRGDAADLRIDDPEVSRLHARIHLTPGGVRLLDLGSTNGTRIGERPVGRAGTPGSAPGYAAVGAPADAPADTAPADAPADALADTARVDTAQADGALADGAPIRVGASVLRLEPGAEPAALIAPDGTGRLRMSRPPRQRPDPAGDPPTPPGPAPERARARMGLLAVVVSCAVGFAVALLTGMWTFLLLALLGPVAMLGNSVGERVRGRRGYRRSLAEHDRATRAYERAVQEADRAALADVWDRHPGPALLSRRAAAAGARLWERRPGDGDFLELALGVGRGPAGAASGAAAPRVAPVTISLAAEGVLGLAGLPAGTLRHLLMQIAAHHSPADLRLAVFSADPVLRRLRDLPHCAAPGATLGVVAHGTESAAAMVKELLAEEPRSVVVVLDDAARWRAVPGMAELLGHARASPQVPPALANPPGRAVVAICSGPDRRALPMECTRVLGPGDLPEGPTAVGGPGLAAFVSAVAPLTDPDDATARLPTHVSLADLLPRPPDVHELRRRWAAPRPEAVIGMTASGPLRVDLRADGPHMLVAGTTGAGKSELLVTLLAALACGCGPDRLRLVLIDYKGGAAFGPLAALPHTAAVLTDLDPELAARSLVGLRAEIRSREAYLARSGRSELPPDGTGPPDTPARLVLAVDEFATLAADLPDFVDGLVDVAQRGRSLGLHLILATQRPSGVVSPAIRANTTARICLRVADDADSLDVIDRPDAARLPRAAPGRALYRSARADVTQVQIARATEPVAAPVRVRLRDVPDDTDDPPGPGPGTTTALDQLVAAAAVAARGMAVPPPPFLPPLPPVVRESDLPALLGAGGAGPAPPAQIGPPPEPGPPPGPGASSQPGPPSQPGASARRRVPAAHRALGLLDRPDEQRQEVLPATAGATLVLGGPGTGVTTALRRMARCAATDGADLLIADGAGGACPLGRIAGWPSTRTCLDLSEPALVQRLLQRLHAALTGTAPPRPALLLIDGIEALLSALDQVDYGRSTELLGHLLTRGPGAGIRIAAGAGPRFAHHRLAAAFGTTIELGRPGTALEGSTPRPGRGADVAPPGRGRVAETAVQLLADDPDQPPPEPPPARFGPHRPAQAGDPGQDDRPGSGRAVIIRPLPRVVGLDRLPRPTAAAVPVGVGGDDARPLTIDLSGPGGLLVCGPPRSGVTTALRVLAGGAASAGLRVLWAGLRPVPVPSGVQAVDLRPGTGALRHALTELDGPGLLVADDTDGDDAPDDLNAVLAQFLAVAAAGQQLALGARIDSVLRSHRGPLADLAGYRRAVLLRPDAVAGNAFSIEVPRRADPVPGRGVLVLDDVEPIQVANPGPE